MFCGFFFSGNKCHSNTVNQRKIICMKRVHIIAASDSSIVEFDGLMENQVLARNFGNCSPCGELELVRQDRPGLVPPSAASGSRGEGEFLYFCFMFLIAVRW